MATTYVVTATRAGQSAVVAETTAKTYVAAMPAVLQENGTSGGGGGPGPGGGANLVLVAVLA